jgi:hypothetical protein
MCALIFSKTVSEIFLILRRNERGMIKEMYIGLHVKYSLCLSDFIETWIFSTDFRKFLKYQSSWKICPLGAELFHADGQTDGRTDEQPW